jgi:hypothetical protein
VLLKPGAECVLPQPSALPVFCRPRRRETNSNTQLILQRETSLTTTKVRTGDSEQADTPRSARLGAGAYPRCAARVPATMLKLIRRYGDPMRRYGDAMRRYGDAMRRHGDPMRRWGDPMRRYGDPARRYATCCAALSSASATCDTPSIAASADAPSIMLRDSWTSTSPLLPEHRPRPIASRPTGTRPRS